VRQVKIDKSFIVNMVVDHDDDIIVRSTIELARNLGLQVVAEGVETEDTFDRLAGLGCDLAQGYYLREPVSAMELTSWLAALNGPAGVKGAAGNGHGTGNGQAGANGKAAFNGNGWAISHAEGNGHAAGNGHAQGNGHAPVPEGTSAKRH
jgi:EAL domain